MQKVGEIFVLDMGEPVKIYDLAVSLIKLSGHEPNVDMPRIRCRPWITYARRRTSKNRKQKNIYW